MNPYIRSLTIDLIMVGDFNWDIYSGYDGKCYSIAKVENSDCEDSIFGDRDYILRLLNQKHLSWEKFTDKGIELLSGAYTRKFKPDNSAAFTLTTFTSEV